MVFSPRIDSLLQQARRHVAAGEWSDALLLLREQGDASRAHPELATMRADTSKWGDLIRATGAKIQ